MIVIKRILSNKFIRGGAVYSIASFAVSVLNYVFNLIVARGFSLSVYGEYMSAFSYVFLFSVPITAFSLVIMRKIGQTKTDSRVSLVAGIEDWIIDQIKRHLHVIIPLSLLFASIFYFKGNLMIASVVFVFLQLLIMVFQNFYLASLQGYKTFLQAGTFVIVGSIVKLILGGLVIWFHLPLPILYIVILVSGFLSLILGRKFVFDQHRSVVVSTPKFRHFYYYFHQKNVYLPLLSTLGLMGLINADIILVKKFMEADVAGLYAGLSLLSKIILYVSLPISTVAFSFFSDDEQQDSRSVLLLSGLAFVLIGLVSVVGYYVLPELIITIVFGAKFLSLSPLLFWAAIFGAVYSLVTLLTQYLVSQNRVASLIPLVGVVTQVGLIYIWHQSIRDVILINIGVTGVCLVFLVLGILYKANQKK